MTTAADKIKQRTDLVAKGYAWNYLKDWQPRVDMYWHRDWLNNDGEVASPAGTLVPNQPGNPDTQMRLSSRGFLPCDPGEACLARTTANGLQGCKGCRERFGTPAFEPPSENGAHSEGVEGDATVVVPPPNAHRHKYKTNRLGSPCTTEHCEAKRLTAFKPRQKAAVPMAEAAA